ncbi:MAG: redoxin domain-containing protein [Alphaproteobacteria bacterium]|jgi:peroxiredoxin|nr:redoxin domain-containing protein [Alphaproteobacteria bacterium]
MLIPGQPVPALDLPLTIGAQYDLSKQRPENFTLVAFYRGSHCPVCRSHLEEMGSKVEALSEHGINPVAVSMDAKDRAMAVDSDWKTGDLPLAYAMDEDTAREWGLYISQARDGSDEPEVFSEPGLFLVRSDGTLYMAQVQGAPFSRPDIDQLIDGIEFALEQDYPPRGMRT